MPTEAEVKDQAGKLIKIFNDFRLYAGVTSTTFLTRLDNYIQALEGDYAPQAGSLANGVRATLDGAIRQIAQCLAPQLLQYGQIISAPETDIPTVFKRLKQYYIDNSLRVQSRVMTFGSITSSGSPVGTGVINRLTKDAYNMNIENTYGDAKTFQCVADEHSGAVEHEETFEFRGATRAADELLRSGSGLVGRFNALSARNSRNAGLQNPSFETFTGSVGAVTAISGWTPGSSISNFDIDTTNYYRDYLGATTPAALKIQGNDYVEQNLNTLRAQINPDVPMYCQLAYNRQVGSGTGVLRLKMGSRTVEVVMAAQTGWNILRLNDWYNWFRNWNEEDLALRITLAGRTTGSVLVDDVIFAPYYNFDGLWYAPVGGATPWLRDDKYTVTDSAAETGILQHWFWRSLNDYLPHANGSSISWSDP